MNNKKTLILSVLILVAFILGASLLYPKLAERYQDTTLSTEPAATQSDDDAIPAPDVTLTDWNGNAVNLHDFIGKPIILNFWASWCGPCQSEMPALEAAYLENGEEIHFIFVNLTDGSRETVASATEFIEQSGYRFPVYFDTSMEATMTYGASSIPLTYFIDADGYLIARHVGVLTDELLQQGIDLIR